MAADCWYLWDAGRSGRPGAVCRHSCSCGWPPRSAGWRRGPPRGSQTRPDHSLGQRWIEMWYSSSVACQTSGAEVPGSNPGSLRISHLPQWSWCAAGSLCNNVEKISGWRTKTYPRRGTKDLNNFCNTVTDKVRSKRRRDVLFKEAVNKYFIKLNFSCPIFY